MSRHSAVWLYIALAVTGAALYLAAHAYATEWRGYVAYGGELVFLGIPAYAVYQIFQLVFKPIHNRKDDPHV